MSQNPDQQNPSASSKPAPESNPSNIGDSNDKQHEQPGYDTVGPLTHPTYEWTRPEGMIVVQPRVWTVALVLVACLISYFASTIFAFLLAFTSYAVTHGHIARTSETLQRVWTSRVGFPFLILVPQIGLALPAIIAATLAPAGFRKRMKLEKGRWPVGLWITGALATPFIGFLSGLLFQFVGESENLEQLGKVMKELTAGGFLIPMALMIGLAPAICEEFVFRGYLQTRLTSRYGSWLGLFLASAAFAIFHMDLVHSLSVFPLGLWLGWLCLRSGTLYPAMLAHFYNNAFSVIASSFAPDKPDDPVRIEAVLLIGGAMGCGFLGIVITVVGSYLVRAQQSSRSIE